MTAAVVAVVRHCCRRFSSPGERTLLLSVRAVRAGHRAVMFAATPGVLLRSQRIVLLAEEEEGAIRVSPERLVGAAEAVGELSQAVLAVLVHQVAVARRPVVAAAWGALRQQQTAALLARLAWEIFLTQLREAEVAT